MLDDPPQRKAIEGRFMSIAEVHEYLGDHAV